MGILKRFFCSDNSEEKEETTTISRTVISNPLYEVEHAFNGFGSYYLCTITHQITVYNMYDPPESKNCTYNIKKLENEETAMCDSMDCFISPEKYLREARERLKELDNVISIGALDYDVEYKFFQDQIIFLEKILYMNKCIRKFGLEKK